MNQPKFLLLIMLLLVTTFANAQPAPRFEPDECPLDMPPDYEIDCGYLIVPENRSADDGDTLALAVAIVRSPNPNKAPDPIIYLEGGPGGSALMGLDAWLDTPFNADRDVILIDQRGTGFSEPFLGCAVDEMADELENLSQCRSAFDAQGIDITAYTSANNAADIADLRVALGYDEVNLYGVSYGTRLALTVMRDHPEGIRSVVLDSPYPPNAMGQNEEGVNFYGALRQMFDDCAADAACNAAYPDLEQVLFELVDAADANPIDLDGEEFYGSSLLDTLFQALYDTAVIPYLPAVIWDTAAGDTALLLDLLDGALGYDGEDFEDEDFTGEEYSGAFDDEFVIGLYFEGLMEFAGFDGDSDEAYDEFFDYLDSLSDDELYLLNEDYIYDGISDEAFDALMLAYFETDDLDAVYDELDAMSDEAYEDVIIDVLNILLYEDSGTMADSGEDFIDRSDAEGMFWSVECYEELAFNSMDDVMLMLESVPVQIQLSISEQLMSEFMICDIWGVAPPDPVETLAVVSDIPTLILTGNYDPITPPVWGELAAQTLSASYLYVFPGVGHGAIDGGDCPVAIGVAFIDTPQNEPDASCINGMTAPEFVIYD